MNEDRRERWRTYGEFAVSLAALSVAAVVAEWLEEHVHLLAAFAFVVVAAFAVVECLIWHWERQA